MVSTVWRNSSTETGDPMPGSGHWFARAEDDDADDPADRAADERALPAPGAWLRRMFGARSQR